MIDTTWIADVSHLQAEQWERVLAELDGGDGRLLGLVRSGLTLCSFQGRAGYSELRMGSMVIAKQDTIVDRAIVTVRTTVYG